MKLVNVVILVVVMILSSNVSYSHEIKSVPYRQFHRVEPTGLKPGSELREIVAITNVTLNGVKGVIDSEMFYKKIMEVSNNLGYKDIEKMNMKGFISWNASITKFIMQVWRGENKADTESFEDLIRPNHYGGEDSFTGACRHYAQFFREVFYATKHMNPNTKYLESLFVVKKKDIHVLNIILMQGKTKVIVTEIEVYKRDIHEEKGHRYTASSKHSMDRYFIPGSFKKNNTHYGAGMRWQKSDFWKYHTKEKIARPYTAEKWNR